MVYIHFWGFLEVSQIHFSNDSSLTTRESSGMEIGAIKELRFFML